MSAGASEATSRRAEQQPSAQDEQDRQEQDQRQERTLAEWVTFGVAAALVLAVAGLVLYLWFGVPQIPPDITISQSDDIRETGGQYYVPFIVRNSGGGTADAVHVSADLRIGGELVETSEQLFDFLSGGESEKGTFVFDRDPRTGELRMSVDSFKQP